MILQRTISFIERISFQIPTQNNCYQERTLQIQAWQEMVVMWWRRLSQSHSVYTSSFSKHFTENVIHLFNESNRPTQNNCYQKITLQIQTWQDMVVLWWRRLNQSHFYTLPFFKALHRECYSLSLHLFNESNRWNFFQEQRKCNLAFLVHQGF